MHYSRLINPLPPESAVAIRSQGVAQLCFQSFVPYAANCRFDFASGRLQIIVESLERHTSEFSTGFKISQRVINNHVVFQAFERSDGTGGKNQIISSRYFSR